MNEKMEKKLKAFLPYLIIIGVVFLLLPVLIIICNNLAVTYIIEIGILPLTALLCCGYYSMKKENDFLLCLAAPLFFIPSIFLYSLWRSDDGAGWLRVIIYLVAYFLCGYLGLIVGDILSNRHGSKKTAATDAVDRPRPAQARPAQRRTAERGGSRVRSSSPRPRRVALDEEAHDRFTAEDPYADASLDTSTTTDDIDAILNEIHNRRSGE